MSDSRTLSARKTLYLDAPIVSIQTGTDPRGFEVGGLPLGNWRAEPDIVYGVMLPNTPGDSPAAVARVGEMVTISLPAVDVPVAAVNTGNSLTITPSPVANLPWAVPRHQVSYNTKIQVAGALVTAAILFDGTTVMIQTDANVNIGQLVRLPGFYFSYLATNSF